ncbi:mucosa-associated lymphoid tissue lymphoma translocation protein 1-like isoform X2 [Ischnura elegans]|uniref:mucosa-associated lymphoid tissue lymphoma translocation protein 1-like isoform X2 n=1 Tax=Ischnura elegans TaxID=197161 RepID=UPI001ED88320|nr:mucosa-associated lymphoid tissue lymphoma translocation protein 1-like isoform X2 [Ischnura elegans]
MSVERLRYDFNAPIDSLSHNVVNFIEKCLMECESWKVLAESFPTIFSKADVEQLSRNASPASRLLYELSTRLCTVGVLAEMLRICKLFMPLYALCEPKPLVIMKQPWEASDYNAADAKERVKSVHYRSTLTLECRAEGLPPPVYAWFKDNEELANETGEILEIHDFGPEDVGEYCCRVKQKFLLEGSINEVTSDPVEVDFVPEPPIITEQPEQLVACLEGSTAVISFSLAKSPAAGDVHLQWFRDNEVLEGCNDRELEISDLSEADEGEYRCYITCKCAELWTETATIKVYRPPDMAKGKFALLIGNAEYTNRSPLKSPSNDVATLAKIFKKLQFKVIALKDLSVIEMKNALKNFCKLLPRGAYVIFYFVGHGFQLQQEKYMLPIDAPSNYLRSQCLCEAEVIKELYATNPRLLVIILDMCLKAPDVNENPDIYKEVPTTHEYTPGRNLVKGYATTSNLGAYERSSETNGIYAKHLAQALLSYSDCGIVTVLEKVSEAVGGEHPDAAQKQMPSVSHNFSRASDLSLVEDMGGDDDAAAIYHHLTQLPSPILLNFKKVDLSAIVFLKLQKETFLNSLEVHIKGAKHWNVSFLVQNLGELSLSIILRDETNTKTVDYALLDLRNIQLVCAWQLWHTEEGGNEISSTSDG